MFERIGLWWRYDGRYMHKEFARGIKNLWRWFPIIWKDRDWDHTYIYKIIETKLQFQAKGIGGRDRHTTANRDAEKMRTVAKLIERCREGFYEMEYMDYHESEIKFIPTDETKKWYTMEDNILSENFEAYFKKYPRQYKRVISGEAEWVKNYIDPITEDHHPRKIAMCIANENHIRCRKLIFKIMESEIERWWD